MADNSVQYGFKWSVAYNGKPCPSPIEMFVDTAESFDVSGGGANCDIGAGDLVRIKSTGGLEQADGTEATAQAAFGVVVGVSSRGYWDGSVMKPSSTLPSDVAWGTLLERQSRLLVVPVDAGVWECIVDEATTATTEAAYQAFVGENVDHVLTGATANGRLTPKLDISTHATTSTLIWRIVGISPTAANQDFSGANVRLLVRPNVAQLPWSSATGV